MKFEKKLQEISEKAQTKRDRVLIILGLSLLVASCCSYFVLDAFGQQAIFELDCPKNSYHGLDNQGNEACRDILSNKILEPESVKILDLTPEKTIESDSSEITNFDSRKTAESEPIVINISEIAIQNDEQTPIIEFIIFGLIGIGGSIIIFRIKNRKFGVFQRLSWNRIQKEQIRNRQYGKCNMCFTIPTKWKYDYFDGNKRNNEPNNCQGLCNNCYSLKIQRDNIESIYQ